MAAKGATEYAVATVSRLKYCHHVAVMSNSAAKAAQVAGLKEWISMIDDFIDYLNAPNPNSIQSKLHAAGCDTMYDDIARSEKKKIARLAAELSSLSESLKGYLISSNS